VPHMFKRRDTGRWFLNYYDEDGKRHKVSLGTTKKSQASDLMAEYLIRRRIAGRSDPRDVMLGAAIEEFLAGRADLAPMTLRWYRYRLGRFVREMGEDRSVVSITTQRILDYRLSMAPVYSQNTVAGHMRVLSTFFKWLVEEQRAIEFTPVTPRVRKVPRQQSQGRLALTPDERRVYAEKLSGVWLNVYMFGTYAGLRLGELAHFERADIRDGVIHLVNKPHLGWTLKDYEARMIPLEPELAPFVALLPEIGPAFPAPRGGFYGIDELTKRWTREVTRLALPPHRVRKGKEIWGVRLHELRHTYASILIQERGVDIGRVMKRMGHSSIMTTQGYFHQFNP